jgi:acylphosphatase
VKGQVQGVGFRMFTEKAARHEGVSGWVANRGDGSVEVLAEGESEAMARFERRVRVGPPPARVESVVVTDEPASGRWRGFATR